MDETKHASANPGEQATQRSPAHNSTSPRQPSQQLLTHHDPPPATTPASQPPPSPKAAQRAPTPLISPRTNVHNDNPDNLPASPTIMTDPDQSEVPHNPDVDRGGTPHEAESPPHDDGGAIGAVSHLASMSSSELVATIATRSGNRGGAGDSGSPAGGAKPRRRDMLSELSVEFTGLSQRIESMSNTYNVGHCTGYRRFAHESPACAQSLSSALTTLASMSEHVKQAVTHPTTPEAIVEMNQGCMNAFTALYELRHEAFGNPGTMLLLAGNSLGTTSPAFAVRTGDIPMALWLHVFLQHYGHLLSQCTSAECHAILSAWHTMETRTCAQLAECLAAVRSSALASIHNLVLSSIFIETDASGGSVLMLRRSPATPPPDAPAAAGRVDASSAPLPPTPAFANTTSSPFVFAPHSLDPNHAQLSICCTTMQQNEQFRINALSRMQALLSPPELQHFFHCRFNLENMATNLTQSMAANVSSSRAPTGGPTVPAPPPFIPGNAVDLTQTGPQPPTR